MRRLILLRHAKSSWKDPLLEDFDRPLNKRGQKNAPLMGQRLAMLGERPEVILSSPAKRACETAKMIAAALSYEESAIRFEPCIYEAGVGTLLELVSCLDNAWHDVMLVGHNPGLTELVNALTESKLENIVTCGVVKLAFETVSWRDIQLHSGRLLFYDYPKKNH